MEDRIKFRKNKQKEFLDLVKTKLNCVSLRGILQFGIKVPYSTLKDYYNENLFIPRNLFEDLCYLAKINKKELGFEVLSGNWGQVKGGKIGKRKS